MSQTAIILLASAIVSILVLSLVLAFVPFKLILAAIVLGVVWYNYPTIVRKVKKLWKDFQ